MPMSARLLRPRSTGFHPEAQDWRNRVIANGGAVSGSTLTAVSNFCRSINAAGLRDKFYRLNLFCGDNLSAALVPLYRAESSTASVRGNTTDTNNNFVSGDFANTGTAAGLKGNGSTKYLATGLPGNSLTATNTHMAFGLLATETSSGYKCAIGVYDGIRISAIYLRRSDSFLSCGAGAGGSSSAYFGDVIQSSSLAIGNILASYPTMYRNGLASGSSATTSANIANTTAHTVFAINNNGAIEQYTDSRIGSYSLGLALTASQAVSYSNALAAFNTALSRT